MSQNHKREQPIASPDGRGREGWYIAWVSLVTGHEGRGEAVVTCREAADAACKNLNARWPEMLHWPICEGRGK